MACNEGRFITEKVFQCFYLRRVVAADLIAGVPDALIEGDDLFLYPG
jgi:hypothetical protein